MNLNTLITILTAPNIHTFPLYYVCCLYHSSAGTSVSLEREEGVVCMGGERGEEYCNKDYPQAELPSILAPTATANSLLSLKKKNEAGVSMAS